MIRLISLDRFVPAFVAVALAAGCGGPHAAQVRGTVTLDDQPLTTGTVSFHQADGKGTLPYGQIDAAGRYELRTGSDLGLAPGSYIVTVVATEMVPPESPTAEPVPRVITPARYANVATSDLKFDVQVGQNEILLQLKSQ